MSVEEHEAAAEQHKKESDEHADQYDPDAEVRHQVPSTSADPPWGDVSFDTEVYNPTKVHKDRAEKHVKHAEQHEAAAQALLEYKEQHCQKFPDETRTQCPLMGQVSAADQIDDGVRMSFHDEVNFQAISEHVECHFAFARTEGYEGMNTCPLYVKGIEVDQDAEARTVTITVDSPEAVQKVRQRAKDHVTK